MPTVLRDADDEQLKVKSIKLDGKGDDDVSCEVYSQSDCSGLSFEVNRSWSKLSHGLEVASAKCDFVDSVREGL